MRRNKKYLWLGVIQMLARFLLLCDTQTNAVLFAGVVYEPGR